MNRRSDLWLAWCGVPFVVLFFVGLALLADFIPPPSPALSAVAIAEFYRDNTYGIRTGMLLCFVGTMFMLAFGSGVISQTKRIRGVSAGVSQFQAVSLAAAVLIIITPIMCWWTAAFRPGERSPESVQLMNDLGCLMFVVGFAPYVTWAVATGWAILSDDGPKPIYPRWSGYFSILVGMIQIPPFVLIYFKTGPFAWDGLFSWWMPMIDFFSWIVVITALTIMAARRQSADMSSNAAASSPRPEMPNFS